MVAPKNPENSIPHPNSCHQPVALLCAGTSSNTPLRFGLSSPVFSTPVPSVPPYRVIGALNVTLYSNGTPLKSSALAV
jgi:hypothetical protein